MIKLMNSGGVTLVVKKNRSIWVFINKFFFEKEELSSISFRGAVLVRGEM